MHLIDSPTPEKVVCLFFYGPCLSAQNLSVILGILHVRIRTWIRKDRASLSLVGGKSRLSVGVDVRDEAAVTLPVTAPLGLDFCGFLDVAALKENSK